MSSANERFERFLSQARRGRPDAARPAPYGLSQAVIARWKSAPQSRPIPLFTLGLARWGALTALVVSTVMFFTLSPAPSSPVLMELAGAVDDLSAYE